MADLKMGFEWSSNTASSRALISSDTDRRRQKATAARPALPCRFWCDPEREAASIPWIRRRTGARRVLNYARWLRRGPTRRRGRRMRVVPGDLARRVGFRAGSGGERRRLRWLTGDFPGRNRRAKGDGNGRTGCARRSRGRRPRVLHLFLNRGVLDWSQWEQGTPLCLEILGRS